MTYRRALTLCAGIALAAGCATTSPQTPLPEPSATADETAPDRFTTSIGELEVVPVHHGTLRLEVGETVIWIDPWSKGDLSGPKADYVFITDIHPDHYDPAALEAVKKEGTVVVAPAVVSQKEPGAISIANGETMTFGDFSATAVPMYNLVRGPEPGALYHEKGRGNGYIFEMGDTRVYLSGDTECTEEMKALRDIDVAFVSMNIPYTMPPSEAAVCIRAFKPKVLYPYHYGDSDLDQLRDGLAEEPSIEIRFRDWYPPAP